MPVQERVELALRLGDDDRRMIESSQKVDRAAAVSQIRRNAARPTAQRQRGAGRRVKLLADVASTFKAITRAHLINFQTTTVTPARIVFFFNDACGRAELRVLSLLLPALSAETRRVYPLPSTDARILNISQGDEMVMPTMASSRCRSSHQSRAAGYEFATMSTWVGNRSVAATDLTPLIRAMTPGQTSVIVDVEIPATEIQKLQVSRDGGADATAFALWNDFDRFRDASLPVSEHVHVSSFERARIHGYS